VRAMAGPFIRSLANDSGETAHLSVLEDMDVVSIDKIDSAQPILIYSAIGEREPAYAVATGKAVLAFRAIDFLSQQKGELVQHTPSTIITTDALRHELREVAARGYAENHGEWRDGVGGVASPVLNGFDRAVAALGISGPLDRLTSERMKALAPSVVESALALSRQLGYR